MKCELQGLIYQINIDLSCSVKFLLSLIKFARFRVMVALAIVALVASVILLNGYSCKTRTSGHRWSWNPDDVGPDGLPTGRPLILGHRGSPGMYPEHTNISHNQAAMQGADIIECDMVLTKVCRILLDGLVK